VSDGSFGIVYTRTGRHFADDVETQNTILTRLQNVFTASGGEGMVVKHYDFIAQNGNELLQSAVKCRGREYQQIIYGPEYMLEDNLERLKKRSLSKKRNLALSEFALGME